MKKTILHIIHSLGRGGAEMMLLAVLKELPEYNNIVVTMYGGNPFGEELKCDKFISMNLDPRFAVLTGMKKLRTIIRDNDVSLVHSHLFWPTVIGRLSVPRKVPLITTIHTSAATSFDYKKWRIRVIDKITYRRRESTIIAVSEGTLREYKEVLKINPRKQYVLYTFADTRRFADKVSQQNDKFRIVTVGALRDGKNYEFLLDAFATIHDADIEFDIYGDGPLYKKLRSMLRPTDTAINFKGEVANVEKILPQYDLYISASQFEGFSLAILEAMAAKVPLLLSNIASFREQCEETATYFTLNDIRDFTDKLQLLRNNRSKAMLQAEAAYERLSRNFTLQHHLEQLRSIYSDTLGL